MPLTRRFVRSTTGVENRGTTRGRKGGGQQDGLRSKRAGSYDGDVVDDNGRKRKRSEGGKLALDWLQGTSGNTSGCESGNAISNANGGVSSGGGSMSGSSGENGHEEEMHSSDERNWGHESSDDEMGGSKRNVTGTVDGRTDDSGYVGEQGSDDGVEIDDSDGVDSAGDVAGVSRVADNEETSDVAFVGELTKEEFITACDMHLTELLNGAAEYSLPSAKDDVSAFYGIKEPSITVRCYLSRLVKYVYASNSTLIVMLIYIQRIGKEEARLGVNKHNMHRVVITALMLACKMLDDRVYSNAHYARVGGVPSAGEMTTLEVLFMRYVGYNLYVNDYMFHDMVRALTRLGRAVPAPMTACSKMAKPVDVCGGGGG